MKVVVGLGATGISCIDYLRARGHEVIAMDSAIMPSGMEELQANHPEVCCILGKLDPVILASAEEIIISPGVPRVLPEINDASARNIPIIGDIELFVRAIKAPIYAITGSNGKTTVTTLVGEMAKRADADMITAGNIGTPVLELLRGKPLSGYIFELSSFQLETTYSLQAKAAVILNISPDHLDRYPNFDAYRQAKLKIYQECEFPIINLDEPEIWQGLSLSANKITFSVKNSKADYGIAREKDKVYLTKRGRRLIETSQLPLNAEHHWQNALCALAFGEVMNLSEETMLTTLVNFTGLPHRCQLIRTYNEVKWFNDSKGTNVGATKTALQSLTSQIAGKLILLAGGLAKDADFSELAPIVKQQVRTLILFGKDKGKLAQALEKAAPIYFVDSLAEAVQVAKQQAQPGDAVLLSPACASFDMFLNYIDRGNQFTQLVQDL